MITRAYWGLGLVFSLCAAVLAGIAHAQELNKWNYQRPGDTLYLEGLHTAAVIQSDYSIGMIVLLPGQDNVMAAITVPDPQKTERILSTLIKADGTTHQLEVDMSRLLEAAKAGDTHMTYNLMLSRGDIALFQAASTWRIETTYSTTDITLKGSRVALDAAMAAYAADAGRAGLSIIGQSERAEAAMARCDAMAAHPWDARRTNDGTSWGDLDGRDAVEACEAARAAGNDNPRLFYQLGRAYDKADRSEAFDYIKKAADELRYPIAFNHLGIFYREGENGAVDIPRAREAFISGDTLGSIPASYNLARLLVEFGNGGGDLIQARSLIQKAADADYPLGQLWLGIWLRDGNTGETQPDVARYYLRKAAENNNARAAYELAVMYRDGLGGPVNATEYLAFLKKAAKGGHDKAKQELGLD